jgi:hypothetical protein
MKQLKILSTLFFSFIFLLLNTSCEKNDEEVLASEAPTAGPFYNQRYCEVLLAKIDASTGVSLEAYNTVGCNSCPEEEWNALNPQSIQQEYSSPFARLDGPRYWVLDSISSTTITTSCDVQFGEIEMSFVASIPISLDMLSNEIAYTVNTVVQSATFTSASSGLYTKPRIESDDSSTFSATVTGLQSSSSTITYNATFERIGTQQLTTNLNTRSVSSDFSATIVDLIVGKSDYEVDSGTGTFSLTGTTNQGNFSYNGSIVFNGDNTATITINGNQYTIDLN